MKSQNIIMVVCWIALILDWTTEVVYPGLASAMIYSWLIMWLFGFFKREDATVPVEKDERSQRQKDFMRKVEEGKLNLPSADDEELQAKIFMMDADGNESSVVIKPDGTIETEGDPDPDVIKAVLSLKEAIKQHGPEAIAEELAHQIEKIKQEKH